MKKNKGNKNKKHHKKSVRPVIQSVIPKHEKGIPPKPIKHKKKAAATSASKKSESAEAFPKWKRIVLGILIALILLLLVLVLKTNALNKTGFAVTDGITSSAGASPQKSMIVVMIPVMLGIVICGGLLMLGKHGSDAEKLVMDEYALAKISGKTLQMHHPQTAHIPNPEEFPENSLQEEEALKEFIKTEQHKGISNEEIRHTLIEAEWDEGIVDKELEHKLHHEHHEL